MYVILEQEPKAVHDLGMAYYEGISSGGYAKSVYRHFPPDAVQTPDLSTQFRSASASLIRCCARHDVALSALIPNAHQLFNATTPLRYARHTFGSLYLSSYSSAHYLNHQGIRASITLAQRWTLVLPTVFSSRYRISMGIAPLHLGLRTWTVCHILLPSRYYNFRSWNSTDTVTVYRSHRLRLQSWIPSVTPVNVSPLAIRFLHCLPARPNTDYAPGN
ncbi:hypothetical protein D9758_013827 [Tetrapyrgos nigripes]|uniref:Uncharacterized protein n=1 Tax=Tetrapyrgos nigripes TaxID=182062 RepID=A0A8H5CVI2_9AGAR|nr:hypothetical protein D9758_013827 [Tetrapyrgos nigripes]